MEVYFGLVSYTHVSQMQRVLKFSEKLKERQGGEELWKGGGSHYPELSDGYKPTDAWGFEMSLKGSCESSEIPKKYFMFWKALCMLKKDYFDATRYRYCQFFALGGILRPFPMK